MVPSLVNLDPQMAQADAEAFGFSVQFIGQGDVVRDQSVEYGGYRPAGTRLGLALGMAPRVYLDWVSVPRFTGLTIFEALHLAQHIGVNVNHRSQRQSGRVRKQSIAAGTEVRSGTTVDVWTA